MLAIQDYDIDIQYILGKLNVVADYLSREKSEDQNLKSVRELEIARILAREPSTEFYKCSENIKEFQNLDKKMSKTNMYLGK